VVGDIKDRPNSVEAAPAFWWPQSQSGFGTMSVVVRAEGDAAALADRVRAVVRSLDPNLAVSDVKLMDRVADASFATPRFTLFLVGLFAALAIVLAAIGIYGVISYAVSRRTQEFGLRMALGAKAWDVERLVLRQGLVLAAGGIGIGLVVALGAGRVMATLLYGVSAADPLTFGSVAAGALAVTAVASYVPARRATSVDPMDALRSE